MIELFEQNRFDELLAEFDKLSPREFKNEFASLMNELEKKEIYIFDILHQKLTKEQYNHLEWLGSTKREVEYLMSIPEDELTDQDWADLKACDF